MVVSQLCPSLQSVFTLTWPAVLAEYQYTIRNKTTCFDGIQNMLPQNRVPWHTEYFRLKEFKKWHVWGGVSNFHLKQLLKLSFERYPPSLYLKQSIIFRWAKKFLPVISTANSRCCQPPSHQPLKPLQWYP